MHQQDRLIRSRIHLTLAYPLRPADRTTDAVESAGRRVAEAAERLRTGGSA